MAITTETVGSADWDVFGTPLLPAHYYSCSLVEPPSETVEVFAADGDDAEGDDLSDALALQARYDRADIALLPYREYRTQRLGGL